MNQRPSLRTIAIALVCLLVPLTMLAGMLTAAYYKSTNPDGVDVTTSLAYLQQTMTGAIVVFVLITAAIVGLIVTMYRQERNFLQAKLPLALLSAVLVLAGALLITNGYTDPVQDQYLRDTGQPTLDEFFERLEQQE
mgnify:CR=1 FL=1